MFYRRENTDRLINNPKLKQKMGLFNLFNLFNLKFGDGEGPNLCRVKKLMLVPHLLKIYFGPYIVSSNDIYLTLGSASILYAHLPV